MPVWTMSILWALKGQKRASSGAVVTDNYDATCEYWEPDQGPLSEKQVLLPSEPSFSPDLHFSVLTFQSKIPKQAFLLQMP